MKVTFYTDSVTVSQKAQLLTLINSIVPSKDWVDEPHTAYAAAVTTNPPVAVVAAGGGPIPVAPTSTIPVEVADEPAKPKRKRRTKAEIAADNLLEGAGANTPAETPVAPPQVETPEPTPVPVAEVTPAVAPVAAPEPAQDGVGLPHLREAMMNAIKRLTDQGVEQPTLDIVGVMKEVTGTDKASEVDPGHFPGLIARIKQLGV